MQHNGRSQQYLYSRPKNRESMEFTVCKKLTVPTQEFMMGKTLMISYSQVQACSAAQD